MSHYLVATLIALTSSTASASELEPPKSLEHAGKTFQLISVGRLAEPGGDRLFYDYITAGETKDAWTSMMRIQFAAHVHLKDEAWARDVRSYFEASKPRPYYRILSMGGKPVARYLNQPADGRPAESGVMRFFPDGCGGQVVLVHLEMVDTTDVQKAWVNNDSAARTLANSPWQPECRADR